MLIPMSSDRRAFYGRAGSGRCRGMPPIPQVAGTPWRLDEQLGEAQRRRHQPHRQQPHEAVIRPGPVPRQQPTYQQRAQHHGRIGGRYGQRGRAQQPRAAVRRHLQVTTRERDVCQARRHGLISEFWVTLFIRFCAFCGQIIGWVSINRQVKQKERKSFYIKWPIYI